jgi:hypothetical protein
MQCRDIIINATANADILESKHTCAFATVLMADRGMLVVWRLSDDARTFCCGSRNFGVALSRANWRLPLTRSRGFPLMINLNVHFSSSLPPPFHFIYSTSPAGAHSSDSSKMTYQLPPMLLNLFAPRPPLRWVEPSDHAPEKRCTPKISGIGQYLEAMREYKDNDGYVPTDSWLQKRDRKKVEKKEKQERILTEVNDLCTSP